jgi:hypothetical protein
MACIFHANLAMIDQELKEAVYYLDGALMKDVCEIFP